MAIETQATWTCDLCGHTARTTNETSVPPGWMALDYEHPLAEREWYSKHLCGDCVKKVSHDAEIKLAERVGVIDDFIVACGFNVNDGFQINSEKIKALKTERDALLALSKKKIPITDAALAGLMYADYCIAVGGKAFDGAELPSWKVFSTDPKKKKQALGWIAAAKTALQIYERRGGQ